MKYLALIELFIYSFPLADVIYVSVVCMVCEVAIQENEPCIWNEICTVSAVIGEIILLSWPYPLS